MMFMNHNDNQQAMITLKVQWWHEYHYLWWQHLGEWALRLAQAAQWNWVNGGVGEPAPRA